MKKHIAEDLPARKHPQAQMSSQSKSSENKSSAAGGDKEKSSKDGEKTPDQKIRQAVYDIRYRARRENIPLRTAYSQYLQNSSMSEMEKSEVRKRLFGKEGGVQAENFTHEMKDFASHSMMNALYKVFVEKNDLIDENQLKKQIEEAHFNEGSDEGERRYKVRVKDPKTNISYVRYATRKKINDLRLKGLEVEMTEHGTPYEGERKKGEQTASALGGGKKAKKDYDGDGKVESGAKEHAGAVHNAIQRKKGGVPDGKDTSSVKEEFVREIVSTDQIEYDPNINSQQLDITNKKNKVVVNPTDSSNTKLMSHHELKGEVILETGYSKFLKMLQEKKMTKVEKTKEKKLKKKYDPSGMKASMEQQYGSEKGKKVYFATIRKQAMKEESECENKKSKEEDQRSLPTTKSLIASKLQSMGMKNPIVMTAGYEPEGEVVDENILAKAALAAGGLWAAGKGMEALKGSVDKKIKDARKTSPIGGDRRVPQVNSYEPEGEVIDERRREEKGTPRKKRDAVREYVRSQNKAGLMTRSGKTVAQHESERGVPERDRPKKPEQTTADRLSARKTRAEYISRTSRELQNDTKRT